MLRYDDAYLPSLSLEAARNFLGVARDNVVVDLGRGVDIGARHIPLDDGMRLIVNYYPPGKFTWVPFADAVNGRAGAETFAGKIVFVGASAVGLGDVSPSPFTSALPGVERHATLAANILASDFLRRDRGAVGFDELLIVFGGFRPGRGVAGRRDRGRRRGGGDARRAGADRLPRLCRSWPLAEFHNSRRVLRADRDTLVAGQYAIKWRRERWIRGAFARYLHPDMVEELSRSPGLAPPRRRGTRV